MEDFSIAAASSWGLCAAHAGVSSCSCRLQANRLKEAMASLYERMQHTKEAIPPDYREPVSQLFKPVFQVRPPAPCCEPWTVAGHGTQDKFVCQIRSPAFNRERWLDRGQMCKPECGMRCFGVRRLLE